MQFLSRALAIARRTTGPIKTADLVVAAPPAAPAPQAEPNVLSLRAFLGRRKHTAGRDFELHADLVAHAEARVCRELLQSTLGERELAERLSLLRGSPDRWMRAAASSLWAGWRAAGGRLQPETTAAQGGGSPAASRPSAHPRHSASHRSMQFRLSASHRIG